MQFSLINSNDYELVTLFYLLLFFFLHFQYVSLSQRKNFLLTFIQVSSSGNFMWNVKCFYYDFCSYIFAAYFYWTFDQFKSYLLEEQDIRRNGSKMRRKGVNSFHSSFMGLFKNILFKAFKANFQKENYNFFGERNSSTFQRQRHTKDVY